MTLPVFTNKALEKMRELQISEIQVLDVFNNGTVEKWTNGKGCNSYKKYTGYEMGAAWFRDEKGVYRITTVWKRDNRR